MEKAACVGAYGTRNALIVNRFVDLKLFTLVEATASVGSKFQALILLEKKKNNYRLVHLKWRSQPVLVPRALGML